jgi:3',5'-cyclic AMP phosphodiesterase CpdA
LWLDALGAPEDVTLVPGNHDLYVRAASTLLSKHLDDYMRGDDGSAEVPFVRRRGDMALIGLSTAIPTLPFMATGALGKAQLGGLAETLAMLDREGLFRIVLIHHPPVSAPSHRFKRLLDGEEFRKVLAKGGAELVLHGHDHVYSLVWLDGKEARIPAIGVPSASAIMERSDDPAGYNLFRIEGTKGAWRCEAVTRGFQHGREGIVEIERRVLFG